MSNPHHEELVRKNFEAAGFRVEKIAEAAEKRCDWRVNDDTDEYIVEEKDKEDSDSHKKLVEKAHQDGSAFGTAPVVGNKRAAEVLRKAAKQVASTPAVEAAFRLIWFASHGADADYVLETARRSLYGNATVFPCDHRGEMGEERTCFYWYHGEFHRLQDIDAVILYGRGKWALCINHFSPRYAAFRKSKLAALFHSPRQRPMDPLEMEKMGIAYIVDGAVDRKNESAIQMFLRKKYNLDGVGRLAEMEVRSIISFSPR